MRLDLTDLKKNKYDEKRRIKIPMYLDEDLAELIGIIVGDGHVSYKKEYNCITICGHAIDDYYYISYYVFNLISKIFNQHPKIKFRKNNNIRLDLFSKAVASFFTEIIGIPSNKNSISVPKCILKGDEEIKGSFLRGFMDTDCSLVFQKKSIEHNYPIIKMASKSEKLILDIKNILDEFKITGFVIYNRHRKSNFLKEAVINEIYISGRRNLKQWIGKIGFHNSKHITKYLIWKKIGYCPPKTNINTRKCILRKIRSRKRSHHNLSQIEDDVLEKIQRKSRFIGELSRDLEIPRTNVSRCLKRLHNYGFIELNYISKNGNKFWILTKDGTRYLENVSLLEKYGPEEIRTPNLPHVKRTSCR